MEECVAWLPLEIRAAIIFATGWRCAQLLLYSPVRAFPPPPTHVPICLSGLLAQLLILIETNVYEESFWVTKSLCPQYTDQTPLPLPVKVGQLAVSQNCLTSLAFSGQSTTSFKEIKRQFRIASAVFYLWAFSTCEFCWCVYVFGLVLVDAWILARSGWLVLIALQPRRIDKLQAL